MKTILVTGGSGFIGSNIINRLMANFDVINFDLNQSDNSNIEQIIGDIRDRELVYKVVKKCDAIIHLAAQVSVPLSVEQPEKTFDINVQGTQNLIDAAHEFDIKRMIVASSAAVYGGASDLPLSEESAGQCLSPYAESKWQNELQIFKARQAGLEAVALRFFNVYGPGQNPNGAYAAVIPKFIEIMSNQRQPTIYGNGAQSRDFVHIIDVVEAIVNLLGCEWSLVEEHAYNIASQSQTTILDLIGIINTLLNQNLANFTILNPIFEVSRKGDILHSVADISLIGNAIDWKPCIKLSEGIDELIKKIFSSRGEME